MNTSYAASLARDLMNQHGLTDWTFQWDRAKQRAGACFYRRKMITLSIHYVTKNELDDVKDTILHEIAHALTPGDHHGFLWQAACRRIGAKPQRCCGNHVAMPEGRYKATCNTCGMTFSKHRKLKKKHYCRKCGPVNGILDFQLAA